MRLGPNCGAGRPPTDGCRLRRVPAHSGPAPPAAFTSFLGVRACSHCGVPSLIEAAYLPVFGGEECQEYAAAFHVLFPTRRLGPSYFCAPALAVVGPSRLVVKAAAGNLSVAVPRWFNYQVLTSDGLGNVSSGTTDTLRPPG